MLDEEGGNEARTLWQRIKREDDRTRVDFTPVTGRTHQVRQCVAPLHVLTIEFGRAIIARFGGAYVSRTTRLGIGVKHVSVGVERI